MSVPPVGVPSFAPASPVPLPQVEAGASSRLGCRRRVYGGCPLGALTTAILDPGLYLVSVSAETVAAQRIDGPTLDLTDLLADYVVTHVPRGATVDLAAAVAPYEATRVPGADAGG